MNEKDIQDAVHDALLQGITSFVISGVFSPIRSSQELQAKEIVQSSCESGRSCSCPNCHEHSRCNLVHTIHMLCCPQHARPSCNAVHTPCCPLEQGPKL